MILPAAMAFTLLATLSLSIAAAAVAEARVGHMAVAGPGALPLLAVEVFGGPASSVPALRFGGCGLLGRGDDARAVAWHIDNGVRP